MANGLTSAINTAAVSPSSVTADGVTVTGPTLPEMIAADQYLAAKAAAAQKGRGLRFTRLRAPGAVTRTQSYSTGGCPCP